jgi:predicted GIY-YIG superfamily endonuclease
MYVYLLKSKSFPSQSYIGKTQNLKNRLLAHNTGKCIYTSAFAPWKISCAVWFENAAKASAFEKSNTALATP